MTKYMTKLMTNRQAINDQNKNEQFWSCNKRPQISHQRSPNQKWSLICGFWYFFWSLISHFPLVDPSKLFLAGTCWMRNLSLPSTSSPDQNLNKNTRRYVENTNKKVVVFFLIYISTNLY